MVDSLEIYYLAEKFRKAIEQLKAKGGLKNDISMKCFPKGACGDTAEMLGEYLLDKFGNQIEIYYVCGTHYPNTGDEEKDFQGRQSHAWISIGYPFESDSLIVDITGDQFRDDCEYDYYNHSVYVGELDEFHSLFEVEDCDVRYFNGINDYATWIQASLYGIYNRIIELIN